MHAWLVDVRYGLRVLLKNARTTVGAALCLAVGIGATISVFSVVQAVLLRPFPFRDQGRLVAVWQRDSRNPTVEISYPNYLDWRRDNHVFQELAAMGSVNWGCLLTSRGEPAALSCSAVSASFFPTLGVQPLFGRGFLPEEDRDRAARAAILSHRLWQDRFGADRALVGQSLTLNGRPFTVVGVMPPEWDYPSGAELWTPVGPELGEISRTHSFDVKAERGLGVLFVVGRLKLGVTLEHARAEMKLLVRRLALSHWGTADADVVITPLVDTILGRTGPALLALCGAVGFLLLLALSNVANLLLAQGITRRRETAVRLALGASSGRIVRQRLTESSLLAVLGGAGGLLIAWATTRAIVGLSPGEVPRLEHVAIDARVLGFTLLVSLLVTLLIGLAPAVQASTLTLVASLEAGDRSVASAPWSGRARDLLALAQLALAVVLLVGAGLLARSFTRLRQVDPGFDPRGLLAVHVELPDSRYTAIAQKRAFYEELLSRVARLPGVTAVGAVYRRPLQGEIGSDVEVRPEGGSNEAPRPFANAEVVTPGYFRAMRIPLVRGRDFTTRDSASAPPVAIVSEGLARGLWPGQDPIGRRLLAGGLEALPGREARSRVVVGVVGDVRYRGLPLVQSDLYTPLQQSATPVNDLMVRAGTDPLALGPLIRNAVHDLDRSQVVAVASMSEIVARELAPWRFNMLVSGLLAATAVLLAKLGAYAVVSYGVARRTHEIGVRMALGASRLDIFRLVIGHGIALAGWGLALGAVVALGVARLIARLLFGVSAHDAVSFAAASLILLAVAALASYLPARRAAALDPTAALRHE